MKFYNKLQRALLVFTLILLTTLISKTSAAPRKVRRCYVLSDPKPGSPGMRISCYNEATSYKDPSDGKRQFYKLSSNSN
ncbi:unnamed protein product [Cyprideis torosa]|uniref:Uncharacterized protein n=1 Tax=Cyprideis torosa TaxID=163714 RepID=A0A7R8W9F4_9CRUS|nr:unnamed protein product [Cyprideis torosa]CAG0888479.1 unnamed protein product [Cyprideis torosa]